MDVLDPSAVVAPAVADELSAQVKDEFYRFLLEYREDGTETYKDAARLMKQNEFTTIYVDFEHVVDFNDYLGSVIKEQYYRVLPFLREALRSFVLELHPDYSKDDKDQDREFHVAFFNADTQLRIRDLNTATIGTLVSIKGTVVRTSAVHPELLVGSFQCDVCKTIMRDIEQQFKYTEPMICRNPACDNRMTWKLVLDQSKFVDFQKIRVQESSEEIPSGSMPRSIDIVLRHEVVEMAKAGDGAVITGTLLVVPDVSQLSGSGGRVAMSTRGPQREGYSQEGVTGLKTLGVRDLTYKMIFLASAIAPMDKKAGVVNVRDEEATAESVVEELTEQERLELIDMKDDPRIYEKLASSIAPTVFGHDEIKRGILLMLFGGVHKGTGDGIKLRGDINVCLVGDPSTSKSQFLKYVVGFVPRAVYTSGKASSAAGLTAAVVRDEDSNEFFVEAGALMLADNGICCIDEFDKMDLRDQVAIHEAMEQQTISITKAGIQATLKARTSVLAAANPVNGRYDRGKSLRANVNMTGPIMSRFDLFFVIIDECNEVSDYNIARHITNVHRFQDAAVTPPYSTQQLQRYIKFARTLTPKITDAAQAVMVREYRKLRQSDASSLSKSSYRITVRQLESMIRLSEALARLHCDDEIKPEYVVEACRLLRKSIVQVQSEDIDLQEAEQDDVLNAAMDAVMEEVDGSTTGANDDQGATSTASTPQKLSPDDDDDVAPADGEAQQTPKKHVSISYDKYTSIATMIIHHLRQLEESSEETDFVGGTTDDVVNWYLETQEENLETEEQVAEEARIVRLVLYRMVHVDNVVLELEDATLGGESDDDDDGDSMMARKSGEEKKKFLVVHPNYSQSN